MSDDPVVEIEEVVEDDAANAADRAAIAGAAKLADDMVDAMNANHAGVACVVILGKGNTRALLTNIEKQELIGRLALEIAMRAADRPDMGLVDSVKVAGHA